MAVFAIFGVVITLGLRSIMAVIPWATIVIGIAVGVLGIAMMFGYQPVINLPSFRSKVEKDRRHSAVMLFGVSYAIASLSCTLPIFLTVVAGAVSRGSFLSGFITFLVYGIGMSVVLIALTVTMALGKKGLLGWLRKSGRFVGRVSGVILVAAGAYLIAYWASNLGDPIGAPAGPIVFIEKIAARLTTSIGNDPAIWGVGFATIVLAAIAVLGLGRRSEQ
jgi:cytochrome c biogenesis protein CcdA